jgi:hypothetical protein
MVLYVVVRRVGGTESLAQATKGLCVECTDQRAVLTCVECADEFCEVCHTLMQRFFFHTHAL